ncbi:hypothetical protein HAX54_005597, partial [Datura stramonium]|nr:hypothetical protein [Datura stramonium]
GMYVCVLEEWEGLWMASYKSIRGLGVEDGLTSESARLGHKGLHSAATLQRREQRNAPWPPPPQYICV